MSTRAYFVNLTVLFSTLTFTFYDAEQVRHVLSETCPFTDFCYTDAQQIWPNNTLDVPCCFPCSCDNDCWELDNCCPDKELINGPRPSIVPCRNSHVKWPYSTSDIGFYRVIDSCPSSEDRSNLNSKCNSENRSSLEDFVWVSDKNGRIYQNIHCAKCHGIKETIPWQIQTTCYDIMRANFVNFKELLLSEKCDIITTPPDDLKAVTDRYICMNPNRLLFSSCNETGLMVSYDSYVETACKQSTWPYIFRLSYAKNAFCMMCNQDIPFQNLGGMCSNPFPVKTTDSALTYLIDYSSVTTDTQKKETNCGLDELFDEFMGLCRKLLCPAGTAPFYGRCKQVVSEINAVISVQFYLDIIWNQTSVFIDYEDETIWNVTHAQFVELLGLNSNCDVCQKQIEKVEGRNSTSDLILVVVFNFNSECEYGMVLKKLADMRNKLIGIYINRTAILTLLVRSDKQPATIINLPSVNTLYYYTFKLCKPISMLSFDDMACPRLQLDYRELEIHSHTDSRERDLFASFFRGAEQNVTSVFICLDKYIAVMSQVNHAPLAESKMTVHMLPVLLLRWI